VAILVLLNTSLQQPPLLRAGTMMVKKQYNAGGK